MITEEDIRGRIRRKGYFNVYQHRHNDELSGDEYDRYHDLINSMIRRGVMLADEGSSGPGVIIAYCNEDGELCLRYRKKWEFGKNRGAKTSIPGPATEKSRLIDL